MAGEGGDQRRTLRDFVTPGVPGISLSIARPTIDAINFEHELALLSRTQPYQFGGTALEDPNLHLSVFLEVCDTLKLSRMSTYAIHLCLFPFSLRDKARARLQSLPSRCITT